MNCPEIKKNEFGVRPINQFSENAIFLIFVKSSDDKITIRHGFDPGLCTP